MKFWGILGRPVQHSYSPIIFNYIFKKYGMDREYLHFEVEDQLLPQIIRSMNERQIEMFNVTHPYKNKIEQYCDEIDDIARELNSINLIHNKGDKIVGYNTDWYGALKSLENKKLFPEKVVLLGSGGASRSIAYALLKINPRVRIWVVSRTPNYKNPRWAFIAKKLGSNFHLVDYSDLEIIIKDKNLIVNCTPLGLKDHHYALPCDVDVLSGHIVLWDLIYNPPQTEWLRKAEQKGFEIMNGLDMLIYQAELGYKIVTGRTDFPIDEVSELLKKHLEIEKN